MLKNYFHTCTVICVTALLPLSILWKGGKAIDATWLLSSVAILAALDLWFTRKHYTKHLRIIPQLLLLLCIWTVLSWLYSTTKNYGLGEVLHTISLSILCMWVAYTWLHATAKQKEQYKTVLGALAFGTFLVSVCIGIAVYILQPVNRFVGTFFDYRFHTDYWPNAWGDAVLVLLPLALWYVWCRHACLLKHHALALVAKVIISGFLLSTLLLSYSRGSVIAAIGQFALLAVYMFFASTTYKAYLKQLLTSVVIIVTAIVFFMGINAVRAPFHEVQSVQQKVTFTAAEGKISVNERAQFWQQSIQLIKERPWFGWGPYSFRFIQPPLQNHVLATSDHSHNVFIKYALERGVIASLTLLLVIASVCIITVGNIAKILVKRIKRDVFTVVVLITICGVIAHNLIDYNLQFVGVSLWLWLCIGILATQLYASKKRSMQKSIFVVIATGLVLLLTRESFYMVQSSLGRRAMVAGNTSEAVAYFTASLPQWFSRDLHVSLMDAHIHANEPEKALEIFEQYRTINTQDARGWKLRGDACRALKQYECAKESYEVALERNQYNDIGIMRWYIQTLVDMQDIATINAIMPQVDALINDYQYAIMNGVHHIGLSQNVEELSGLLTLLSRLYSSKNTLYIELREQIEARAKKDRDFVDARSPGLLW